MMAKTREQKERAAFEEQMARKTAALCDFARAYIGRLVESEREQLLSLALEQAWQRRAQFRPEKASLLTWWDGCLRAAADTKPEWQVIWYDNSLRRVSSNKLGKGVFL